MGKYGKVTETENKWSIISKSVSIIISVEFINQLIIIRLILPALIIALDKMFFFFFNPKVLILFLFLQENICCGYTLEVPLARCF